MTGTTSDTEHLEVAFRPRPDAHKICPFCGAAATLEAICGKGMTACCEKPACKDRAADFARAFRK